MYPFEKVDAADGSNMTWCTLMQFVEKSIFLPEKNMYQSIRSIYLLS